MIAPHADEFIDFASKLEGQSLSTNAQGAKFAVAQASDGLEITPSSGKSRIDSRDVIQRVCDEYASSKSLRPTDYQSITFNASYLLKIIDLYV